jgi:hypothetical protein
MLIGKMVDIKTLLPNHRAIEEIKKVRRWFVRTGKSLAKSLAKAVRTLSM